MELFDDKDTDILRFTERVNDCRTELYQCRFTGDIFINETEVSELMGLPPGDTSTKEKLNEIISENHYSHKNQKK